MLGRALQSGRQPMSPEGARFILDLDIREDDRRRALELSAKQQDGQISEEERSELESYVEADNVLSVLRASALLALKQAGQMP